VNWSRFIAILLKEFRQVRRDRLTFGMMVGVPIMQLVLFGFAINSDPKHLPLTKLRLLSASGRNRKHGARR
jgi:ABC-2 type transport system permease protein